ncbi:glutamate ABC transporter substrate-binding protein [Glycomyces sp. TRM65418]|uniref:glutamate ABC transporter substrate-binding protein n=1 Tax=Glycomyces sp. TRM65418 TaxID=2867006 RepID=UPI001CE6D4CF|nr:glutamate ABC transporter substrate-binding protein [Glycomyces sp. TRM65418]MCC3764904.1 glutamate ABC transporter substrate-binding protein [Glycomyces sp. TRM65418]QZD54545.1 glutamate ABC transporter substrate-binding protein [Glycomyces sp. TRM65418]
MIQHRIAHPKRTVRLAVVTAAAAGLLLAACTGPADMEPPNVDVPTPLPAGIDFAPDASPAEPDTSCDPLASYNPAGVTAEQARATLDNPDQISIGISQSTNLMGYYDPVTSRLEGFDIDIARALVEAIMGDETKVKWVPMTSGERESAVNDDRVDMVVRTMSITCDRWENVEFSSEYFRAGQRLLVSKDSGIEGLTDMTAEQQVCTGASSTSVGNIAAVNAEVQPVTVPDFNDCLVLLQQGTVDAVAIDDTILAGMAVQDPTLHIVGEPFSQESYGIAFEKGNTDLARFVNGALAAMIADNTWQTAYDTWLKGPLGVDATAPSTTYRD